MSEQQLWDVFTKSGKIEHYLQYVSCKNKQFGGSDGTDKNKRADTQSNQP